MTVVDSSKRFAIEDGITAPCLRLALSASRLGTCHRLIFVEYTATTIEFCGRVVVGGVEQNQSLGKLIDEALVKRDERQLKIHRFHTLHFRVGVLLFSPSPVVKPAIQSRSAVQVIDRW